MLNAIIGASDELNEKDFAAIIQKEYVKYMPNRNIILFPEDKTTELIKDFPSVQEYEYDNECFGDMKEIIDSETYEGHHEEELFNGLQIDYWPIRLQLIDDIEEIEEEMKNEEDAEKVFDNWINVLVSRHVSEQVAEIISKFESLKEGYFFEPDSIQSLKYYHLSSEGKRKGE